MEKSNTNYSVVNVAPVVSIDCSDVGTRGYVRATGCLSLPNSAEDGEVVNFSYRSTTTTTTTMVLGIMTPDVDQQASF